MAALTSPDEFGRYLRKRAEQDAFSGVVLITQGSSRVFSGAYGYASRSWKVPARLTTRFDTASVTKLFTAVGTLQLIDRGLLAFDTPVIDFLGLRDTSIADSVNVFHLLTHTSGIADDADEVSGEDYADIWKTRANYSVTETADFLPQFAYKPPNFPPGQGCRYCNCGYVLLGLLIEKASGLSYRDYDLFLPAHRVARRRSIRHRRRPGPVPAGAEGRHPAVPEVDSGVLHPQVLLTPQVLHHEQDDWNQMYGYAMWFALDRTGHVIFAEKEGINAGASAVIRHYPDEDVNVVLLANTQMGAWEPLRAAHRLVTAGR